MEESLRRDIHMVDSQCIDQSLIKTHIDPHHGTTTLAFVFKEGMIIAVDSRATSGAYIASQSVNKVIEVNKYLIGTMAGGAADCFYWEKLMGLYAKKYELDNNRRITAAAASMYLSNKVYNFKGRGLSMGTMICGYDRKGPSIYYVDNSGQRLEGKIFSVGSGSTIAYGILNSKYRYDLNKEQAIELGKEAIFHAAHRDAFSGGFVSVYFMNACGWEKVGSFDVDSLNS